MAGPPSSRSSFGSSSGEPSMRRLGVGASSSGDRPLRAQIVVALAVVCILIAVPLYLLRRPGGKVAPAASASASSGPGPLSAPPQASAGAAEVADGGVGKPPERLKLGSVQHVRCGASANAGHEGNLCDALPFFEDALTRAIRENPDCGPKKLDAEGTLNYVLTVDFSKKKAHLFPGASGKWHDKQARRSTSCVQRALSAPDWSLLQHQHRFYTIAVLATYLPTTPAAVGAAPDAPHSPTGTPSFE